MTDYIKRADAIEAVCDDWCGYPYSKCPHKPQRMCDGCDTIEVLRALPSADAVSEDTQTEEQARFVAKETELAHIEARLENAEKRLQGVCVANFVAEQLERLREMTDEERWEFFKRFFEVEGGDDE